MPASGLVYSEFSFIHSLKYMVVDRTMPFGVFLQRTFVADREHDRCPGRGENRDPVVDSTSLACLMFTVLLSTPVPCFWPPGACDPLPSFFALSFRLLLPTIFKMYIYSPIRYIFRSPAPYGLAKGKDLGRKGRRGRAEPTAKPGEGMVSRA